MAWKAEVSAKEALLDGLLIPGGFAPDDLRRSPDVLALVRHLGRGQSIGAICHAGWVHERPGGGRTCPSSWGHF